MKIRETITSALLLFALCLITACSGGDSPPATTTPPVTNTPSIVADAGPDQSVFVNSFVTLNGVKSFSTENPALTYIWSLRKPAGSGATLVTPDLVNPTMTVDIAGTYEATLIVKDGKNTSLPDTVLVVVGTTNVPPAAAIAQRRHALFRTPLTVDGSTSNDANKDLLAFKWELSGRPAESTLPANPFTLGDTAAPVFTPDVLGLYTVRLIVNDGAIDSAPAEISISVENKPGPTAAAGSDQTKAPILNTQTVVNLSGAGETVILNEDGTTTGTTDGLTFKWDILPQGISPAPDSTGDLTKLATSFTVPSNKSGTYIATLTVTEPNHPDKARRTAVASALIKISPKAIALPDAGRATPETTLSFTGDTSFGTNLTYQWELIYVPASGKPGKTFPNPYSTNVTASFANAPAGTYTANLKVTDALKLEDMDSATYVVTSGPMIERVSLDAFSSPFVGQAATSLDLSSANGWTFPAGQFIRPTPPSVATTFTASLSGIIGTPTCTWTSANSNISFSNQSCTSTAAVATIAASAAGNYNVTLQVSDLSGSPPFSQTFSIRVSNPPTITLTPTPSATPGVCTLVTVNAAVTAGSNTLVEPYTWTITTPTRSRNGTTYISKVRTPMLDVAIPPSPPTKTTNFKNPALFTHEDSGLTPSAMFRPDLPAPFTVTLAVANSLGIRAENSIDVKSEKLTDANALSFLTGRNTTCGRCHILTMWGVTTLSDPPGTEGPNHTEKGLQLFSKFTAATDPSFTAHTNGTTLPMGVTRENLCALFQDFTKEP